MDGWLGDLWMNGSRDRWIILASPREHQLTLAFPLFSSLPTSKSLRCLDPQIHAGRVSDSQYYPSPPVPG